MERWLATVDHEDILRIVDLGLAHEQQHQELILTDVLHAFSLNPLRPAYGEWPRARAGGDGWVTHEGGLIEVGAKGDGFRFDNEEPRHRVWLEPFEIACGLAVRALGWRAPLYTRIEGDACVVFGPEGEREVADDEPARHLSFYEADAIARWCGARLPTEFEWEVVAATGALDAVDDVAWQWTSSAYGAYPRYRPASGALGECNGKFMAEQFVLRGGSDFTPTGHSRPSYRNFWPAATRFQRTGVRLARDPR